MNRAVYWVARRVMSGGTPSARKMLVDLLIGLCRIHPQPYGSLAGKVIFAFSARSPQQAEVCRSISLIVQSNQKCVSKVVTSLQGGKTGAHFMHCDGFGVAIQGPSGVLFSLQEGSEGLWGYCNKLGDFRVRRLQVWTQSSSYR